MANRKFETDEDKMIHQLRVHRNMIGWVIEQLKKEGIDCERTVDNDPSGDILFFKDGDVPKVQQIIRDYNKKYNT